MYYFRMSLYAVGSLFELISQLGQFNGPMKNNENQDIFITL